MAGNEKSRVGVLRDPVFLLHSAGAGHVESPERLRAIDAMLQRFPLKECLLELPARDATREELCWVHDESYVRGIEQTAGRLYTELDPDTSTNEHSYAAAARAAGGVISSVEACVNGGLAGAFALARPPGHHAEAGFAMGFCLFNNVAVASQYALRRLGMDRVLIFDWDVHHGNGTMHAFYDTNRVLYASVHEYPHYPGSGRIDEIGVGPGAGYTVNVPLPAGQGDADYEAVIRRVLRPIALQYQPQLIIVSAGFDVARGDPLGGMRVSAEGFARMTELLLALSSACCPGRLVFALEGGYDLGALAAGVSAVLETLAGGATKGKKPDGAPPQPGPRTDAVIDAVLGTLQPYWKPLA
jgi:acetoin utilization deacetylase AcuC-like enzyme